MLGWCHQRSPKWKTFQTPSRPGRQVQIVQRATGIQVAWQPDAPPAQNLRINHEPKDPLSPSARFIGRFLSLRQAAVTQCRCLSLIFSPSVLWVKSVPHWLSKPCSDMSNFSYWAVQMSQKIACTWQKPHKTHGSFRIDQGWKKCNCKKKWYVPTVYS